MSDRWFKELAAASDLDTAATVRAPARLKARIYSALVEAQASTGPLLSLSKVKAEGRDLCVFENLVASMPIGERLKMKNPCRVCHARLLGERLDRAPIFWPACPYADFHKE
jgi:hypothetical protein